MKRNAHQFWKRFQLASYWYFLAAFIISAIVAVAALRQNNLTALHLRNQVLQADQQNGDVEGALRTLREYVYGHMNTDLASGNGIYPPIQLKYSYERQSGQSNASTNDTKLYNDAQNYCEKAFPNGLSGRNRLPCIQQYIDTHGSQTQQQTIPDSLYKFDFVSPIWSPDLAGWSLVVAAIFLILFIFRFGLDRWFKHRQNQDL